MTDLFLDPERMARERRILSLWLAEWNLDLALRDTKGHGPWGASRANNPPAPQVGDIRLLPPAPVSVPDLERPVYVAVLQAGEGEGFDIAPFSRFSVPATPQEWLTGRKRPPLRVLSLWNMRRVPAVMLSGTWRVSSLSPSAVDMALAVHQDDRFADKPKPRGGMRVGPPLIHPLDPRFRYITEERMLLDELLEGLASVWPQTPVYEIPEADAALLRAAEWTEPPAEAP